MRISEDEYLKALAVVKAYSKQIREEMADAITVEYAKSHKLIDTDASVRLLNCVYLRTGNREIRLCEIAENYTELSMSLVRNFGPKGMEELKSILSKAGLKMKKK